MAAITERERRRDWQKRADVSVLQDEPPEPPPDIDRMLHALMAQATQGIAPASLALAFFDWAMHLGQSPGKWQRLMEKAVNKDLRWLNYAARLAWGLPAAPCIEPLPQDRRFRSERWQTWPYNLLHQAFLLNQQWWFNATTGIDGVSAHHEQVMSFAARQLLDLYSPLNFFATNPDVAAATVSEGGANLARGALNLLDDQQRRLSGAPPAGSEAFRPGHEVAATPGRVVFRNRLIELIQYAPATAEVHAAPILIVPAWIMKYYILDLSPQNSLIRHLVAQGHTVFCVSWRNPTEQDRDLGLDDYRTLGIMAALDAVGVIVPDRKIHAAGYCLGGTLLSIGAAAMARSGDERLGSLTLFAAQTDFTEPGELALFIDDSQLHVLESMMWNRGYLDAGQMAGAFQLLRSNDLIWSRIVHDYLMGERTPMNDLMAWNADTTRMPYKMHAQYLRKLYLGNALAAGHLMVDGHPVSLQNIRTPLFIVGTERDHVAPWRSVYKVHALVDAEVTFVLASGGHNAGIVSEPGHPRRHFRIATRHHGDASLGADEWAERAETREGSWWLPWIDWLASHSSAERIAPPAMGDAANGLAPLADAPGSYVLQR